MRDIENRSIGFIVWHRQVMDKGYDPETYMIWSYLVMLANHTERIYNGIKIKRGQILTGRKSLHNLTKIAESKIERILTLLESEQQIEQQKTNKYRIITVKNYDSYQNLDSKVNNSQQQRNSRRTTKNTPNNDKNVNNDNNNNIYIQHFEHLWSAYPRKLGKAEALKRFTKQVTTDADLVSITSALSNYKKDIEDKKTEEKFIAYGSTWFNEKWRDWIGYKSESNQEEKKNWLT